MNKKAEEVTIESVYKEFRQTGHNAKESAKRVLDIVTGGMWAIMDEHRIEDSIKKIIARFEPQATQKTQASNKVSIKLSQKQWESIGKKAGWMPKDPSDVSDTDLGPVYTADDEEIALQGPDDNDPEYSFNSGILEGKRQRKLGHHDTSGNPYRIDTPEGQKKFDDWMRGFEVGWNGEV
jgi:hypothetical protein